MFLSSIPVDSNNVLVLASLLKDDDLARKLETSVERDAIVIRLDDDERATVLKALTEPPPELEDVRAGLLSFQVPRPVERLAADNAA